jgi:hypothetical protein
MKMNKKTILLVVIFFFLVLIRFSRLDLDAAANNISGITTWDEPYYTFSAMYDLIASKPGFPKELKSNMVLEVISLHSSFFTKIGFFIAGNTMEGMRLGPVLVSLLTILLLFQILKKTFIVFENNFISYKWVGLFLLLTEPTFFMFSRAQTPQIYSVFWISILIYLVFQYTVTRNNIWVYLASVISVLLILWVYPYNIYASLALGFFVLLQAYESKEWRILFFAFSGIISGFLVYLLLLKIYGFEFIDYVNFMKSFRYYRNESDLSNRSLYTIALSPLQILYTNLLRFNPVYLVLIILMPFIIIKKLFQGSFQHFLIIVLLCAFLQSFGISSYPFKKWVTLFPIVFLSLPLLYNFIKYFGTWTIKNRLLLYVCVLAILFKMQTIINTHEYWSGFDKWFIYQDPGIVIKYGVLIFLILSIIYFELVIAKRICGTKYFLLILTIQSILLLRTSFLNQTDSFNRFTKTFSGYLNDKVVLSDSEIYTLNSNAVVFYNYMSKQLNIDLDLINKVKEYSDKKSIVIKSYIPNRSLPIHEKWGDSLYLLKYKFEDSVYSFAIYE